MNAANKLTDRSGLLVIDKPAGPTSMRAVSIVRRCCHVRKAGHAGTLDPMASGVLLIAIGRATKSLDRFMRTSKGYRTTIDLSATSPTDDLESQPVAVSVERPPSEADVARVLEGFAGRIEQVPPVHSAVNVGGFRSYELARQGIAIPLASRTVHVHALKMLRYHWPALEIELVSSKGLYVRSLARDIGRTLNTGGYCASLRRTAVGPFDERMATPLDNIRDPVKEEYILSLEQALAMLDRESPHDEAKRKGPPAGQ